MHGHNMKINFKKILHVTTSYHKLPHVTSHVTVNKVDFTIFFLHVTTCYCIFYKSIIYIYFF